MPLTRISKLRRKLCEPGLSVQSPLSELTLVGGPHGESTAWFVTARLTPTCVRACVWFPSPFSSPSNLILSLSYYYVRSPGLAGSPGLIYKPVYLQAGLFCGAFMWEDGKNQNFLLSTVTLWFLDGWRENEMWQALPAFTRECPSPFNQGS